MSAMEGIVLRMVADSCTDLAGIRANVINQNAAAVPDSGLPETETAIDMQVCSCLAVWAQAALRRPRSFQIAGAQEFRACRSLTLQVSQFRFDGIGSS